LILPRLHGHIASIFPNEHIEAPMFSRRSLLAALAVAASVSVAAPAFAADPVVFAAASLKNALDDVAASYKASTGKSVTISYAGSNVLAKQIEEGAPSDIFFSADLDWMKYVADKNLIKVDSQKTLLGNAIVIVVPKDSTARADIAKGMDLAGLLGKDGKLAMANVDSVPAGKYGKASLVSLGLWDGVASRVVQADNVRAALTFVARGEAPVGIVYATDAAAEPAVKVLGAFPEDSHPPILYPVALTAKASADAEAFFDYMKSPAAAPAFRKQGFTVLAPTS
jgi:molybdate transport system substrate-binding protein